MLKRIIRNPTKRKASEVTTVSLQFGIISIHDLSFMEENVIMCWKRGWRKGQTKQSKIQKNGVVRFLSEFIVPVKLYSNNRIEGFESKTLSLSLIVLDPNKKKKIGKLELDISKLKISIQPIVCEYIVTLKTPNKHQFHPKLYFCFWTKIYQNQTEYSSIFKHPKVKEPIKKIESIQKSMKENSISEIYSTFSIDSDLDSDLEMLSICNFELNELKNQVILKRPKKIKKPQKSNQKEIKLTTKIPKKKKTEKIKLQTPQIIKNKEEKINEKEKIIENEANINEKENINKKANIIEKKENIIEKKAKIEESPTLSKHRISTDNFPQQRTRSILKEKKQSIHEKQKNSKIDDDGFIPIEDFSSMTSKLTKSNTNNINDNDEDGSEYSQRIEIDNILDDNDFIQQISSRSISKIVEKEPKIIQQYRKKIIQLELKIQHKELLNKEKILIEELFYFENPRYQFGISISSCAFCSFLIKSNIFLDKQLDIVDAFLDSLELLFQFYLNRPKKLLWIASNIIQIQKILFTSCSEKSQISNSFMHLQKSLPDFANNFMIQYLKSFFSQMKFNLKRNLIMDSSIFNGVYNFKKRKRLDEEDYSTSVCVIQYFESFIEDLEVNSIPKEIQFFLVQQFLNFIDSEILRSVVINPTLFSHENALSIKMSISLIEDYVKSKSFNQINLLPKSSEIANLLILKSQVIQHPNLLKTICPTLKPTLAHKMLSAFISDLKFFNRSFQEPYLREIEGLEDPYYNFPSKITIDLNQFDVEKWEEVSIGKYILQKPRLKNFDLILQK
ncbi:hypothetical protein M0811_02321 [Anaeramoeba ignava]|uniref:C2 NT-type domain-containing protein n=1 Tax=Anaeramoeba ignava TaxID=1746090 RepID=A0A9Q0R784_ANAIG|nr:hypothetical protein M0811_02321 [Anaeramoeba ignava]